MKKILLGGAAAAAFGLLATPAFAQLELTITGSIEPEFGFVDEDRSDLTQFTGAGASTVTAASLAVNPSLVGSTRPTALGSFSVSAADSAAELAAGGGATSTLNQRSYGSTTRFILRFAADGTADNGLRYGIRVRLDDNERFGNNAGGLFGDAALRTRGGLYVREAWGYARGSWGEVRAGESPIVYNVLNFDVPSSGISVDGNWDRYISSTPGGFSAASSFNNSILTRDNSGHPSGISYLLNNYQGLGFGSLSVGLTYAPTTQGFERTADLDEDNAGFSDVVSFGLQYRGEFSGVRLGISGGVNFANAEDAGIGVEREDVTEWRIGGLVGYGGFTLSGFYQDHGEGGFRQSAIATGATDGLTSWGVGGGYTAGPWNFSIGYYQVDGDPIGAVDRPVGSAAAIAAGIPAGFGTRDTATSYVVGGGMTYSLAPGLTPYASVVYFDNESVFISDSGITGVTDFSNEGVVGVLGVTFSF